MHSLISPVVKIRFALLVFFAATLVSAAAAGGYRLVKEIPVSGDGAWDYLTIDSGARRLYVSHGTQVEVVDLDSEQPVGKVTDLNGVHGIAIAPKLGRGFITSGLSSTVTIFDLKTLKHLGEVPAGKSPDGVLYDSISGRVFAFNHHGDNVTVFGASDGKVAGTIELGGEPEFPVNDEKGNVWVNLENKSTLVRIDAQNLQVTGRWPTAPCVEPASMAIDREHKRLFIGCGNQLMAVANPDTGKIITTMPIGVHVDATAFDPKTGLIFNANNGSVTIIHQDSADKYSAVETVSTKLKANTLAVDPKTLKVYLPSATVEVPKATPENPHPAVIRAPGTFKILVLGK
ncbi:MAG: YncE family protein [Candidatus Sulfotelmatobacter sp.]